MNIVDVAAIEGRRYPARRRTQNLVGGASPIQATNFSMGIVTFDPNGGQVPWHNHEQEEVYLILEGSGELAIGDEIHQISAGQVIYIPSGKFHQLTNLGDVPLKMVYVYGPAGIVDHWKHELAGTLPKAGVDAPPMPTGAAPQHTSTDEKP